MWCKIKIFYLYVVCILRAIVSDSDEIGESEDGEDLKGRPVIKSGMDVFLFRGDSVTYPLQPLNHNRSAIPARTWVKYRKTLLIAGQYRP